MPLRDAARRYRAGGHADDEDRDRQGCEEFARREHVADDRTRGQHDDRIRPGQRLRDGQPQLIDNPFSATRDAVARNTWAGRGSDLRVMGAEEVEITDLLSALADLPATEPLTEKVARLAHIPRRFS